MVQKLIVLTALSAFFLFSASADEASVDSFRDRVANAAKEFPSWNADRTRAEVKAIVELWSEVETQVRNRSAAAYSDVETQLSLARVASNKTPLDSSLLERSLAEIGTHLSTVDEGGRYGAWDAAFVLFREGLEALLVLAALLAFLTRSGQSNRRVWVWSGAASGLFVSVAAALALSLGLAAVSASSAREATEGYVGIVSVVLMLTVGYWLHTKSNVQKWNAAIKKRVGDALRTGSLISLALVAFVAVVREGAESIVFLLSMASSMPWIELTVGIASALAALAVLGMILIRFAAKLPLGAFFTTATILIHYLAFKILGESVHALQAAGVVGAHEWTGFPSVSFLGIYPTWEGLVPQAILLVGVSIEWILAGALRKRDRAKAAAKSASAVGASE